MVVIKFQPVVAKNSVKMFWGIIIDAGKRYSQVVKQGFHISMAALEAQAKKPSENVQVMLQHDTSEYLLCTLNSNNLQQPLDLNFVTGEQVSFSLNGSGVVHLTGFLIPDEEDFDESFSDSEEEEDVPSLIETPTDGSKAGKRKAVTSSKISKKLKLSESLNDNDDDEDENDEDEDDEDSEEEEGFSDDFDDEFDDEDEDIDEAEISLEKKGKDKSPKTLSKTETPVLLKNKQNAKTPVQEASSSKQDVKTPKTPKSPKQTVETPQDQGKGQTAETPSSAAEESAKKKKKRKKKKNKEGNTSQNESTSSTPGTTPNSNQGTATPKPESTPKKRVVAGGTVVEDLKVGHGPEAKPGKMASVYYVGTLAKNNKRFDSCTEGKPFRFRLNQGEVIKGWDNGVLGMKVGGKRRITVPANQGYGNVKQGPIPPNSVLVFEVELKAVS